MKYDNLKYEQGSDKKLSEFDTDYKGKYKNKKDAEKNLERTKEKLSVLQDKLYAHDKYSVLLVFQAMDAAGKDGTIKHVLSGINPQGCSVVSFKTPSAEELDHDYLWRCTKQLPEKGRIGVFNRSYYEEMLICRVHPELIQYQRLPDMPKKLTFDHKFWEKRFEDIRNYEKFLSNNGVIIMKFFLHVSKDEQKQRFIERINDPAKNWKFSIKDVDERNFWDDYMKAYEDVLKQTSTENAPWYVIPADKKWFMRTSVSEIIINTLEKYPINYPTTNAALKSELAKAKKMLESEK